MFEVNCCVKYNQEHFSMINVYKTCTVFVCDCLHANRDYFSQLIQHNKYFLNIITNPNKIKKNYVRLEVVRYSTSTLHFTHKYILRVTVINTSKYLFC